MGQDRGLWLPRLALLSLLIIGGCTVLVGKGLDEADKAIKAEDNKPGGPDNPMTIKPGEAFEVDGFTYADGWTLGKDSLGYVDIKKLKVTNERDDKDSALVEIKFWKGSEVLASSDCSTNPIDVGTTVTVSCSSADKLPKSYDKITINDTF